MRDLFLRFPDEATAKTHIYEVEYRPYIDEDGSENFHEILNPRYRNMDVIGLIDSDVVAPPVIPDPQDGYTYTDGYTDDGEYFVEVSYIEPYIPVTYVPIPGYHVNLRALPDEDTSSLEQFCVHPTNPRRVWA